VTGDQFNFRIPGWRRDFFGLWQMNVKTRAPTR
jgi:hypothetical protein